MQQVRMQYLSQLYISKVMARNPDIQLCFSTEELCIACVCATAENLASLQEASSSVLKKYPAWTAPQRPASNREHKVEWKLPLADLQVAVERRFSTGATAVICSPSTVVQGHNLKLQLQVGKKKAVEGTDPTSAAQDIKLGLYLNVNKGRTGAVCKITTNLAIRANMPATAGNGDMQQGAAAGFADVLLDAYTHTYSTALLTWGYPDVAKFGSVSSWLQVEAILKEKQLVHTDGCIHLEAYNIKCF